MQLPFNIPNDDIALPLPTDALIAKTEESLGVSFPEDVKAFLKEFNGANLRYATFFAAGHEWCIDRFLNLLPHGSDTTLAVYGIETTWSQLDERMAEDPEGIGAELVPLVVLFAGDFVCLDYRKTKENPPVVVWLHEESRLLKPSTRPVAETFTEFMGMIHPDEPSD